MCLNALCSRKGLLVPRSLDRRAGKTSPRTILLIEADDVVRKALQRTLESRGYRVLQAITGEEAALLCRHHEGPIDLLLSDISLPGLRGPDLARIVTDARPFTRILFLTAESEEANMGAGICPGCWLLIRKPFRPQELAVALQEFLSRQVFQPLSVEALAQAGLVE